MDKNLVTTVAEKGHGKCEILESVEKLEIIMTQLMNWYMGWANVQNTTRTHRI